MLCRAPWTSTSRSCDASSSRTPSRLGTSSRCGRWDTGWSVDITHTTREPRLDHLSVRQAYPRSAKFELKVTSDGSVSGKLSGAEIAPGEITSGKYDANTGVIKFIAWVKAADGSNKGGDVQFEGRVANDSITGAMKLGDE